jgi:hypothetical protein
MKRSKQYFPHASPGKTVLRSSHRNRPRQAIGAFRRDHPRRIRLAAAPARDFQYVLRICLVREKEAKDE